MFMFTVAEILEQQTAWTIDRMNGETGLALTIWRNENCPLFPEV